MAFSKNPIPFENVIYSFFSFKNKPWGSKSSAAVGQNRMLPGVQKRVHQWSKLSAFTQTLTLCGCTQF